MKTLYPSRAELLSKIQPDLDWTASHSEYAQCLAPTTFSIDYLEGERPPQAAAPPSPPHEQEPTRPLAQDLTQLLGQIAREPGFGIKHHYDALGFGIERGNRALRQLKGKSLITIAVKKSDNPKGGRSRLVAELTVAGKEWLTSAATRT